MANSLDTNSPDKYINKRSRRISWKNDGPSSSINSLTVLLDWLTTEEITLGGKAVKKRQVKLNLY